MPKCGGNPASLVEKPIAWGTVTTANVRPTSRLPRKAGKMRGKALTMAFIGAGLFGRVQPVFVSECVSVTRQGWHDGNHQPVPRCHERALLVARRSGQGANVVRNVPALLVVECALFSRRHVAADEPRHDRVDPREIHARIGAKGIRASQCGVDRSPLHYRTESLKTVTLRASLAVHMGTPYVVVTTPQCSRHGNL